jgi:conjugal transfer mating pair stabilization protein TraG
MAEIETNRDYYGNARFDDTAFQLSGKGQALQRKFVEGYAGQIRSEVERELVLKPGPAIQRTGLPTADAIRSEQSGINSPPIRGATPGPDAATIRDEVARQQGAGRSQIDAVHSELDRLTADAKGASAGAADGVKKWKPSDR